MLSGEDVWGHWFCLCTGRKDGTVNTCHFYQRISGIWTAAAGFVVHPTQPPQEVEKAAVLATCQCVVTTAFNDIQFDTIGVAATNMHWYLTVMNYNPYTEA